MHSFGATHLPATRVNEHACMSACMYVCMYVCMSMYEHVYRIPDEQLNILDELMIMFIMFERLRFLPQTRFTRISQE